jgi:hypothetical protein
MGVVLWNASCALCVMPILEVCRNCPTFFNRLHAASQLCDQGQQPQCMGCMSPSSSSSCALNVSPGLATGTYWYLVDQLVACQHAVVLAWHATVCMLRCVAAGGPAEQQLGGADTRGPTRPHSAHPSAGGGAAPFHTSSSSTRGGSRQGGSTARPQSAAPALRPRRPFSAPVDQQHRYAHHTRLAAQVAWMLQ